MRFTLRRMRQASRYTATVAGSLLGSAGLTLGLAGCSGDTVPTYEPITDPAQIYANLVLNAGAVNLSTASGYETFQLTATPVNALGEPLDLPGVTFHSTDTSRVLVSPSGLMKALKAGTNVKVWAELRTSDNVAHSDTTYVNVVATDPPPVLATLTIDPTPPDSAIWPRSGADVALGSLITRLWISTTFPAQTKGTWALATTYLKALTPGGTTVPSLQVEYFSLDPNVARINQRNGRASIVGIGQVRFVVRTVAYGVVKADTTTFTVTNPVAQAVSANVTKLGSIFDPSVVYIRQGGVVYFATDLSVDGARVGQPVDIVFDDPTNVDIPTAGICDVATTTGFNPVARACDPDLAIDTTGLGLSDPPPNGYRLRQFSVPGTYTYRDRLSGAVGKIVVVGDATSEP